MYKISLYRVIVVRYMIPTNKTSNKKARLRFYGKYNNLGKYLY